MSYKLHSASDDCYPGTHVLINKLGITDEKELNEVESMLTSSKSAKLFLTELKPDFGFPDYKEIHYQIFNELYDWAGKIRTIPISKMKTVFTAPDKIEDLGTRIFSRLKKEKYFVNYNRAAFIEEIADLYNSLNRLHPFREGNGRTEKVFITQLIHNAGYDISFDSVNSETLMIGSILAVSGSLDVLRDFFDNNITPEKQA